MKDLIDFSRENNMGPIGKHLSFDGHILLCIARPSVGCFVCFCCKATRWFQFPPIALCFSVIILFFSDIYFTDPLQ
jgi:hypothetical protein